MTSIKAQASRPRSVGKKKAAKRKVGSRYFSVVPKTISPGRIVVHNHVQRYNAGEPGDPMGINGSRAWTDVPNPSDYTVVKCSCGWARHLGTHYRVQR